MSVGLQCQMKEPEPDCRLRLFLKIASEDFQPVGGARLIQLEPNLL